MLGEERQTFFFDRSTVMKSGCCLGPPVSCCMKASLCAGLSLVELRALIDSSKGWLYLKRSEGMYYRYLRRWEYWSSRLMIREEGYFIFILQRGVVSAAGAVSRLRRAWLRPFVVFLPTTHFSFLMNSSTQENTLALSLIFIFSPLTMRQKMALYFIKNCFFCCCFSELCSTLALWFCSSLRSSVSYQQYLARMSATLFISWRQVSIIFSAMLCSSLETRAGPALRMFCLIRVFSDLARVLLRNTEVAQRQRSSSGVMPSFQRCSHLRQMLSRALTVSVYFFTNWNRTGTLFILRLLLNLAFLAWNSSSCSLDHFPSRNQLLSLIFTLVNSFPMLPCTFSCRTLAVLPRSACTA